MKSLWGSSRSTRFALLLFRRLLTVLFLGVSGLFDGARMADLNLMNGHAAGEDELDSSYLDKDGGGCPLESCSATPNERQNEKDTYR